MILQPPRTTLTSTLFPDPTLFRSLEGFNAAALAAAGIGRVEEMGLDTYSAPDRFFSFRRATHRGEADYGRQLSAHPLPCLSPALQAAPLPASLHPHGVGDAGETSTFGRTGGVFPAASASPARRPAD